MDDKTLISGIQSKDAAAFEELIDKYAKYVSTVINNVSRGALSSSDIEELSADVFVALWSNSANIDTCCSSIKPYLGAIARNAARSRLRTLKVIPVSLEEDILIISDDDIQRNLIQRELKDTINILVGSFPEPDKEIFIRYYYFFEKVKRISEQLNINESTVKTKLSRSRGKLKHWLYERGFAYENQSL